MADCCHSAIVASPAGWVTRSRRIGSFLDGQGTGRLRVGGAHSYMPTAASCLRTSVLSLLAKTEPVSNRMTSVSLSTPFVEGLDRHELRYQGCRNCGAPQTLARYGCRLCGSTQLE